MVMFTNTPALDTAGADNIVSPANNTGSNLSARTLFPPHACHSVQRIPAQRVAGGRIKVPQQRGVLTLAGWRSLWINFAETAGTLDSHSSDRVPAVRRGVSHIRYNVLMAQITIYLPDAT